MKRICRGAILVKEIHYLKSFYPGSQARIRASCAIIRTMAEPARGIRVKSLREQGEERDLTSTTPSERLLMVWQLTLDAWAFERESFAEPQLQRHVVRLAK